jgi:hypothetical protein
MLFLSAGKNSANYDPPNFLEARLASELSCSGTPKNAQSHRVDMLFCPTWMARNY